MFSTRSVGSEEGDQFKRRIAVKRFQALGGQPTLYFTMLFGMVGHVYGHITSFLLAGFSLSPKAQFKRLLQRAVFMSGSSLFGFAYGVSTFGDANEL